MNRLSEILWVIAHPLFWVSNYPCNDSHDKWLRDHIVNKTPIQRIDAFTVEIDGKEIWVENYPYAFGRVYDIRPTVLPRRYTRKMLFDRLRAIESEAQQRPTASDMTPPADVSELVRMWEK